MASPLRKTPSDFAKPVFPVLVGHLLPCGVNQAMSLNPASRVAAALEPAAAMEDAVLAPQLDERPGELEQRLVGVLPVGPGDLVVPGIALLFPRWVRPISSPPSIIGTPCESNSAVRKPRCIFARMAFTAGSSVGPSTPQFHDRL